MERLAYLYSENVHVLSKKETLKERAWSISVCLVLFGGWSGEFFQVPKPCKHPPCKLWGTPLPFTTYDDVSHSSAGPQTDAESFQRSHKGHRW